MITYKSFFVALLITLTISLHFPHISHKVENIDDQTKFHDQMTAMRKAISNRIEFYKKTN
jgi:hypothetical protein